MVTLVAIVLLRRHAMWVRTIDFVGRGPHISWSRMVRELRCILLVLLLLLLLLMLVRVLVLVLFLLFLLLLLWLLQMRRCVLRSRK